MADLIERDETREETRVSLSLRTYGVDTPGEASGVVRVAERRDGLIVLEFREPAPARRKGPRLGPMCRSWWDAAMILLLIASAAACALSFVQ